MRLSITPEISALIAAGAPVAISVSGGKDSQASALAVCEHLDRVGHAGARILVHSDLGSVEWRNSHSVCQDLADHLGLELVVLRRDKGGLMERWESRWQSSVVRYQDLATVTLVPCWSTPSMRFCIAAEARITPTMPYVRGWPTRMLTDVEADILASVRREVTGLFGFQSRYLDRDAVHGRYAQLLAERAAKVERRRT